MRISLRGKRRVSSSSAVALREWPRPGHFDTQMMRCSSSIDAKVTLPGSKPRELRGGRYRQIIEPPCRIFYRREGETVYVLYVMRGERKLRPRALGTRSKKAAP